MHLQPLTCRICSKTYAMQTTAVNSRMVAATQVMFDASMAALTLSGDMHDLSIVCRDEPQTS